MKLNRFLFALFLSFFILKPVSYARDRVSEMPNLIILLADDLGYGELGCQGNDEIPTPHIDGIAKKGVRFTQGYVTAPNCSPSRAGLITGKYGTRFGHEFNPIGAKNEQPGYGLPLSEKTLAWFSLDGRICKRFDWQVAPRRNRSIPSLSQRI
jgi:arylsulfatase B